MTLHLHSTDRVASVTWLNTLYPNAGNSAVSHLQISFVPLPHVTQVHTGSAAVFRGKNARQPYYPSGTRGQISSNKANMSQYNRTEYAPHACKTHADVTLPYVKCYAKECCKKISDFKIILLYLFRNHVIYGFIFIWTKNANKNKTKKTPNVGNCASSR